MQILHLYSAIEIFYKLKKNVEQKAFYLINLKKLINHTQLERYLFEQMTTN